MDRNSKEILGACIVSGLVACVALAMMSTAHALKDAGPAPSLECSVDDTLTFVAYDVTSWDMRDGTLVVRSVEDTHTFTLSRDVLDGETCREVFPEGQVLP